MSALLWQHSQIPSTTKTGSSNDVAKKYVCLFLYEKINSTENEVKKSTTTTKANMLEAKEEIRMKRPSSLCLRLLHCSQKICIFQTKKININKLCFSRVIFSRDFNFRTLIFFVWLPSLNH